MNDPFQELLDAMINGADSQAKAVLKSCSRATRYEFLMWLGDQTACKDYERKVIKWCILGKWT
ncbi:MAG: hypothetical protein ACTSQB_00275 [Candidatus Heimdallarchaeota archaeon]